MNSILRNKLGVGPNGSGLLISLDSQKDVQAALILADASLQPQCQRVQPDDIPDALLGVGLLLDLLQA
jgi:hypothetical protein